MPSVMYEPVCVSSTGQLAVGTCEIVMLNRDSSQPKRTIARQTARCACRRGQIAGTTRARPACVDALDIAGNLMGLEAFKLYHVEKQNGSDAVSADESMGQMEREGEVILGSALWRHLYLCRSTGWSRLRCCMRTQRPVESEARIVKSKQWCEMSPCSEGEICGLLFNRSGWTCTKGGGRIKTVTLAGFNDVMSFITYRYSSV
ncbi:hypothetical protein DNTS_007896 [Danionella cerebrum]|uniref:TAFA chemokine like family member 5 n=1 Tax=Danionella cerebrum TaxID=2873325 RepID=A0A553PXP6_9TELE|nr:hypothetical protein DNTS_007896 [Danionella translucida]